MNNLFEQASSVYVIHYSCESFYDRVDGTSPRITSIAVQNLSSGQVTSFSIHQVAERHQYSLTDIERHYNTLETQTLSEFYEFVKLHTQCKWVHWNMRDINYGFQALAHRLKVLGGEPYAIPESSLFDLSRALIDIYGNKYIEHPRLERLMEKNEMSKKNFLSGKEEAEAFKHKDYVKLHQSTLRKVDILSSIADGAWRKRLITNAKWSEVYGSGVIAFIEIVADHWLYKILGFIGIIASIIGGIVVFK